MEQLTKNQAVATSQEAVQNQNEPQLRDENAHNDKSVHGVLNPTYQAGLRRDAVQPDIEAERKKRDEIEAGKSYCSRRFGGARSEERRVGKECRCRRTRPPERCYGAQSRSTPPSRAPMRHSRLPTPRITGISGPFFLTSRRHHTTSVSAFLLNRSSDLTTFNQILKQNAKREMRMRLEKVTVADVLAAQPVTTNLLKFMRASIKMIGVSNLQSFIASMTQKLTLSDISDESKNYLDKAGITTACLRIKSKWTAGGK